MSGVNISCGYYNAHTTDEYVVLEEMQASIEATKKLLEAAADVKVEPFEFVESRWNGLYDYDDVYSYGYGYQTPTQYINTDEILLCVYFFTDDSTTVHEEVISGASLYDCWGQFFIENPGVCFNDVTDYELL